MPHVSSPVAYPASSSPPQILESFTERRKRGSSELQSYPSKRRTEPGGERLESQALTSLGSSILLEKPFDGNKENLSPGKSPSRILDKTNGIRVEFQNGYDRKVDSGELIPDSMLLSRKNTLGEIAQRRSGVSLIEKLPQARTSQGEVLAIRPKQKALPSSSDRLHGKNPRHVPGEAERSFYGVEIHRLVEQIGIPPKAGDDQNARDVPSDRSESPVAAPAANRGPMMLWTEKYRAKKFTDLIGDDRTHREVLRWLKGWDAVVFPASSEPKATRKIQNEEQGPQHHTKILMLTGSPGLGKTTLAHVCARQAGYEVLEINASDERSRDVVKGKIKDCVGTENVKGVNMRSGDGKIRKKGRPFCVIVDEVDGAASGASSGEGGFIKALVDLVLLDRKTSNAVSNLKSDSSQARKKGDRFQILRPIILICNDVYHSSLRPIRATKVAEIVHIRKPPLDKVVTRISSVFDREGVPHDNDGVRRLCEAAWGIRNRREQPSQCSSTSEGDLRSVLVAAEWVVSKLRQGKGKCPRLTKTWIEDNILESLMQGGGGARGVGRGNAREVVERVFRDGAGFPSAELLSTGQVNQCGSGFSDARRVPQTAKRTAMQRLQQIVDTSGESDHIINDCFAAYPSHQFQDDTFLSKPNAAHEWLYFHDRLSSKVHSGQEWELQGYLSQATLGLHHLFASPAKSFGGGDERPWNDDAEETTLFMGSRPEFEVSEVTKENKAILHSFQSSLSTALLRGLGSATNISTELLPNVLKMLTPDVKPVIVGGSGAQRGVVSVRRESERKMIQRAVGVMSAIGVNYQQIRVDSGQAGLSNYIYRMEPSIDALTIYRTASKTDAATQTRYAIRQALDQEYRKFQIQRSSEIRQARNKASTTNDAIRSDEKEAPHDSQSEVGKAVDIANSVKPEVAKRDFFGRVVNTPSISLVKTGEQDEESHRSISKTEPDHTLVWVTFNEGFSNAVRKPITLVELLQGF